MAAEPANRAASDRAVPVSRAASGRAAEPVNRAASDRAVPANRAASGRAAEPANRAASGRAVPANRAASDRAVPAMTRAVSADAARSPARVCAAQARQPEDRRPNPELRIPDAADQREDPVKAKASAGIPRSTETITRER